MSIGARLTGLLASGFMLFSGFALAADQAIVSTRTIYPGQIIEAADLKAVQLVRQPTIRYRFATRHNEIAGLMAVRTILRGHFIPVSSAQPAPLVKAGATIRIHFTTGHLAIRLEGVALSDGKEGDTIRLRNPASGKTFSGRVLEDGSVAVERL